MDPQAVSKVLWQSMTPFVFLVGVPIIVAAVLLARALRKRIDPQASGSRALLMRGAVFALQVVAAAIAVVLVVTGLSSIG